MTLAHLTEAYMSRLLVPDQVRKQQQAAAAAAPTKAAAAAAAAKEYKGGFSSRFKLNEERLKKLVADVVEMGHCFAAFLPREDLTLIMASINSVREMLTIDSDHLLTVFEQALRANPVISTHGALGTRGVGVGGGGVGWGGVEWALS
jgi:hypothetical protein